MTSILAGRYVDRRSEDHESAAVETQTITESLGAQMFVQIKRFYINFSYHSSSIALAKSVFLHIPTRRET